MVDTWGKSRRVPEGFAGFLQGKLTLLFVCVHLCVALPLALPLPAGALGSSTAPGRALTSARCWPSWRAARLQAPCPRARAPTPCLRPPACRPAVSSCAVVRLAARPASSSHPAQARSTRPTAQRPFFVSGHQRRQRAAVSSCGAHRRGRLGRQGAAAAAAA